jgi:two-component system response regulator FixJ
MQSARTPTIFVVDDDDAVGDAVAVLLRSEGYRVAVFGSAAAFLDGHQPDGAGCLLADVRMPDMTGLELQELVVERRLGLPTIIMTGHGDVGMAVRAMKAGAVDFLEKPFPDTILLEAVQRALTPDQATRDGDLRRQADARLATLTPREREVFDRLVLGLPNKMIASELALSPRTVEVHRARVMAKMDVDSLAQLVRLAVAANVPLADPD